MTLPDLCLISDRFHASGKVLDLNLKLNKEQRGNAIALGLHHKISFVTILIFALFSFKDFLLKLYHPY